MPFEMANIVGRPTDVVAADTALGLGVYVFSAPVPAFIPFNITGQIATSRILYSNATQTYWLSDRGVSTIYEVSVNKTTLQPKLLQAFGAPSGYNFTDIALASVQGNECVLVWFLILWLTRLFCYYSYLYALSPQSSSFVVLSLKGNITTGSTIIPIQTFNFSSHVDTPINLVGAAVYTP